MHQTVYSSPIPDIYFRIMEGGPQAKWTLLHLHGDESCAKQALRSLAVQGRANALFVEEYVNGDFLHDHELSFEVDGGRCVFDPNHVFSQQGRERYVRFEPADLDEGTQRIARQRVAAFAQELLQHIEGFEQSVLLSAHNNSHEHIGRRSLRNLQAKRRATDLFLGRRDKDLDSCVRVNSPELFEIARSLDVNAVFEAVSERDLEEGLLSANAGGRPCMDIEFGASDFQRGGDQVQEEVSENTTRIDELLSALDRQMGIG